MYALIGLFVLLAIVDLVQTYHFGRYGLREGNPVLAKLLGRHGFDELVLVKYAVILGLLVASAEGLAGPLALGIAVALQAAVVGWNAAKMHG